MMPIWKTCQTIAEEDLIQGQKFESLTLENVIYVKLDNIISFLEHTAVKLDNFVLLTHNSDFCITQKLLDGVLEEFGNIIYWFGQNMLGHNYRATALPIGLENDIWFPEIRKKQLLFDVMKEPDILPEKLCYCNFSLYTNGAERVEAFHAVRSFSTIKIDGLVTQTKQTYEDYLSDIKSHYFVVCPSGNGIDTHRLWETLYLGRIPVIKRNQNIEFFSDLPILVVDDWAQITGNYLIDKIRTYHDAVFNCDKMSFSWWKNSINQMGTIIKSR